MRDSFAMDSARHNDSKKAFVRLSRTGCLISLAIFACTLVAVALLVYNFAVCPTHEVVVTKKHVHVHTDLSSPSLSLTNPEETDESSEIKVEKDLRLPRSVNPVSYDVTLLPFLIPDNFTFNGEIEIRVEIMEHCRNITLHSHSLQVIWNHSLIQKLDSAGNAVENVTIKKQYFVEDKQFLVLETSWELEAKSEYLVKLSFIGSIKDNLQGFYKSSYKVGSETRWLASTQFQATDARRAFPCFDEPSIKAKFKITLGRPVTMKTLSNMPLEKTVVSNEKLQQVEGYIWDIYEESVPMSTYLVAFVVCDFVSKSDGKNFSVWTRKDAIRSMDYSLKVGTKALSFLEDFFGIDYPLPKTDMIAIPDFAFGAMGECFEAFTKFSNLLNHSAENWGLIVFRETTMLYEEGVSPMGHKINVAAVISHEIAHQVGSLVANINKFNKTSNSSGSETL